MNTPTFYWHDYETSGADKQRDRPLQFAGIRTTLDLIPVGDPLMVYCRPAEETLPHPTACMITGLTPQLCQEKGLTEAAFARRIHQELAAPGTCGVGYNSLRFDDEMTRHLFYRSFFEPYDREWQNGNSRWDLIDLTRLCYALRPDGIQWPTHPDGTPSFRLEDIAKANGLVQSRAHDALSDVEATISLARLLRDRQPALFDFHFNLRRKQNVLDLMDVVKKTPLLHASAYYPAKQGCITAVVPLATHPHQNNGVIVFDLMGDPTPLLEGTPEELAARVFQSGDPDDPSPRLAISVVHANRSPALAPLSALKGVDTPRIGLDLDRCRRNLALLQNTPGLSEKARAIFSVQPVRPLADPELSLYNGFPSEHDKRLFRAVRECHPTLLGEKNFAFQDRRYQELLFRYRARNWPETLNEAERAQWAAHRQERIVSGHPASSITLDVYRAELAAARANPELTRHTALFDALDAWGDQVSQSLQPVARPRP